MIDVLLGSIIAVIVTGAMALTVEYAESTMRSPDFQQLTSEEVFMVRGSGFSAADVETLSQHLRQQAASLIR